MEDWTYKTLVGIRLDYYIHKGRLFYSSEEGMIMQLELLEGKPEQHEIYRTGEISEGFISHFAIRGDGSILHAKKTVLETTSDVAEAAMVWAAGYERRVFNKVIVEEKKVYGIQERELRIQYAIEIYGEFVEESD